MLDNKLRPKDRKLSFVAPVAIAMAVFLVVLIGFMLRGNEKAQPALPPPPQQTPAPVVEPVAVAPPSLTRADLIAAAAAAADRYASGPAAGPAPKDALVGRAFRIRIAFGCDGAQPRSLNAQAFTEYDPARGTLRLVARPADWSSLPLLQGAVSAKTVDAVEGFWLPLPWRSSEGCPTAPPTAPAPTPTPPAAPSLGLAQLFGADESRLPRRGERAYNHLRRLPQGDPSLLSHAYWLILEGRIVGYPDGSAIRCASETPDHRPVCLFAVSFDRIAFDDSVTGDTLAEWGS